MTSLMLRASSEVINQALNEISAKGYTSVQISQDLNLAVQLVENFLTGEIVDRHTYDLMCTKLHINEESSETSIKVSINSASDSAIPDLEEDLDILMHGMHLNSANHGQDDTQRDCVNLDEDNPAITTGENHKNSFNTLANQQPIRDISQQFAKAINYQCDRLKIIDNSKFFKLRDLYTEVKLFHTVSCYQYLDLEDIFPNVSPEYYDQFYLNKLQPATLDLNQAIADHQHILLVGGLGAGKTTLLKYLALACINDLMPDLPPCLPVYLPLRSLVNANSPTNSLHSLHAILRQQLDIYGWSAAKLDAETITKMLSEGQFWLLWDELDDLPEYQRTDIGRQIAQFSDQYPQNPMAIATRNPSLNYILPSFAALEIAPLQSTQVYSFASQWFKLTNPDNPKKIEKFQQLLSSSQSLTEIGTTPLFLSYLCNYFNNFSHIKPDFYRDILYLCLTKWQDCKCVASPEPNTTLSTAQKLDFLSYLAIVALDRHGYIWQNQQLEKDMQDCLATSRDFQAIYPSINHDILYQSLRSQHSLLVELAKGIHSLRHTAIHDYLAAYRIANIKSNVAEKYLLDRIYLKRWHGVIVLTASITQNADQMLQTMKRKIDELVINDSHLQSFLTWVNQQSLQIQTPYKVVTIRALYLDIDLENTRSLDRARALDIAHSRSLERARIKAMGIDNTMETEVDIDYTINLALNLDLALYFTNHPIVELACAIEPDLRRGLQFLRQKFPDPYKDRTNFAKWWQTKGLDWSKKLRALIVHHRKGSQDWKFSDNQLKVLRTYHDANKLLIECLYSAEYVSPLVKGQIESSLLLPQNEYSILTGRG